MDSVERISSRLLGNFDIRVLEPLMKELSACISIMILSTVQRVRVRMKLNFASNLFSEFYYFQLSIMKHSFDNIVLHLPVYIRYLVDSSFTKF